MWEDSEIFDIVRKAERGERLSETDALRCLKTRDLAALGYAANQMRKRISGEDVFYSVYLNINYTNICENACPLCAFYRSDGESDSYLLSVKDIISRVEWALQEERIREVHIVGGVNPQISFDYILEMIRKIRSLSDLLYIKAFSAVEIAHFATQAQKSLKEILGELQTAGLDGLPGGGAEIFSDRVREWIAPRKINSQKWLQVHEAAHELGLMSNATMLYGHFETPEEIVDHLESLRSLQDKTHGFQSFIPLPFHPVATEFENEIYSTGGFRDARIFATSRLYLDNFAHLKTHWPAFGLKFSQILFSYGADDLGGTASEEKVFHEAGSHAPTRVNAKELEAMIREVGYFPVCVDSSYRLVRNG